MHMVCRNLCERLYSKIIVGTSKYEGGKKYCRRCEIYFLHDGSFCPCCGMKLRLSPTGKKDRERLRQIRSLEQLTEIHERQNNKGAISKLATSPTTSSSFTPPS